MPQSKRSPKSELFLSESGCKKAAALYKEEVDRRDGGQNEICEAEDISPSTGTKFSRLTHGLISVPDPSTIMRIGRQIIDPDTGRYFDAWKFLLGICCALEPRQLVKVALSIDPLILEEFPRPVRSTSAQIDLKAIEKWIETAPPEAIDSLSHLLSQDITPEISSNGKSPIANLTQSHMDQLNMKPFEFARRCGLKAADIRRVIETNEPLDGAIASGLAYGFSYSMDGWTAEMVRAIDPVRFPAAKKSDQKLDRAIRDAEPIHA